MTQKCVGVGLGAEEWKKTRAGARVEVVGVIRGGYVIEKDVLDDRERKNRNCC